MTAELPIVAVEHEKGRVKIVATGAPGGFVSVDCTHPSGRVRRVRSMTLAPLSGGAFIGWDYESPIGLPVTYQATYYADANTILATSNKVTVTWQTQLDWLKDPLQPARNMPIGINDPGTPAYATPTGVFPVLGRPSPVTVGDVRQAAQGDITFLTGNKDEAERFHFLTASGHVLLLQSSQASGIGSMYLQPLNLTETHPVVLRDEELRLWTLSYQEVDSPVGDAKGALTTYADVLAQFSSYQDILDTFDSYLALLEGVAGTVPQETLAWRGQ